MIALYYHNCVLLLLLQVAVWHCSCLQTDIDPTITTPPPSPPQIDLPPDVPGRIRLQKYRGLKSFRLSPWDARESLPREYARVFAFTSFR